MRVKERIQELTNEMIEAEEQQKVILTFIEQMQDMPNIVLDTLNQKVRKLNSIVKDCQLRLKNYE